MTRVGVQRERLGDGSEVLRFSLWQPKMLIGIVIAQLLCIAAIVASFHYLNSPIQYFASLLPAGILLACGIGMAEMVFWRSSVTFSETELRFESGYAGYRTLYTVPHVNKDQTKRRSIEAQLACRVEFQKSDGAWWSVCVQDSNGKLLPLIRRLDGEQEAKAVREWLEGVTGIKS